MFELRILSGLHRGATLPLDERTLLIGADDEADVVLVDPDIATRHATLTLGAAGWSLSAIDGALLGADHNRPLASLDLRPGDCARLGHVWLTVADPASAWENPPAEPAHDDAEGGAGGSAEEDDLYSDAALDAAPAEPAPPAQPPAAQPPAAAAKPARKVVPRAGVRRSKVLLALGLVTVLSACAAYQMRSGANAEPARKTLGAGSGARLEELAAAAPPAPGVRMGPAALREAFRQRLKEVDLLKRVNLDLKDREWTMQASLDGDEAARFDRMLKTFVAAHNITFPVHAKVGSAEAMLPFRIREVISGSNASVVTQDGNRLYVGDDYRGMRLVAIDGRHLQFDGERKVRVKW